MLVLLAGNASAEHGWVVGQLQKSDRLPARPSSAHGLLVLGPKCPLVDWAGCSLLTVQCAACSRACVALFFAGKYVLLVYEPACGHVNSGLL